MDRFDLEQKIMQCWNIIDDIKFLQANKEKADFDKVLDGIVLLYSLKFDDMFSCFEDLVSERKL